MIEEWNFENAPVLPAHYSPAVSSLGGRMVFVSGQLPIDPVSREKCLGDIKAQTGKALENVEKILQRAGAGRANIVKTTAYISSMEDWGAVNEVYAEFFGELKPSRTIVCVKEIHFGMLVEIDAIAIA